MARARVWYHAGIRAKYHLGLRGMFATATEHLELRGDPSPRAGQPPAAWVLLATELDRRDHKADPPSEEALVGPYLKALPDDGLGDSP